MPARRPSSSWDDYAREIGHNLRRARQARGLSQERVAAIADIAAFTYQKFEKGESKPGTPMNPTLTTLIAVAQALSVELSDLLPQGPPDLTSGR